VTRLALIAACAAIAGAAAAPHAVAQQRARTPAPPAQQQPAELAPELPLIYEPQLLRLSETLGVIAYMSQLCGDGASDAWRLRAEQLIEAEAVTQARRERLAGAYNRGFIGHQAAHRTCGERSRLVIERQLQQAREIAKDISNRFGG
jgi:uncharacterized protein (TIGR02301 family)